MKSPGGSIFPYYYKGGEIHCLKYGSKFKNEEQLFELMKQEEAFIMSTNRKLKVWVDLYETSITKRVLQELTNNIENLKNHIDKLSFVGLSVLNIWRLRRKLMKLGIQARISFYADPEEAKTWLVSER